MKKRVFAGVLLCLAVMQLAVQYPAPVISQDVSVDSTVSITTVTATADLASLSQRDGMAVLIKTGANAGLWRYSKASTATVDDTTVLNGPGSVGRFLQITIGAGAASLDGLHDLTGKTAPDLDPDATIEFVYYDVNEGTSYKVPLDELRKKGDVSTVANVAALFSATHARDNQLFQTLGHTTEGIGANLYRYDASSTATIDGVFTFPGVGGSLSFNASYVFDGTAGTGRFIADDKTVVDVTKSGASGDGVSDDASAYMRSLAVANALGVEVFFPPGTYLITGASATGYTASSGSLLIRCAENAIIKGSSSSPGGDAAITPSGDCNISISGGHWTRWYIPIFANTGISGGRFSVQNAKFSDVYTAIASNATDDPTKVSIIDCDFTTFAHKAVDWKGIANANVRFINNYIHDASGANVQSGVQIGEPGYTDSKSVVVTGNTVSNIVRTALGTTLGIFVDGATCTITDNTLVDVYCSVSGNADSEGGIYSKTIGGVVSNNTLINAGRKNGCIVVKGGAGGFAINGNSITMTDSTYNPFIGIRAYCDNAVISGNVIDGLGANVDSGILLGELQQNVTVKGNMISNCVNTTTTGRAIIAPKMFAVTISDNTIYKCGTSFAGSLAYGIDVNTPTDDVHDIIIKNNTIQDPVYTAGSTAIHVMGHSSITPGLTIDGNVLIGYHVGIHGDESGSAFSDVSVCNNMIDGKNVGSAGGTAYGIVFRDVIRANISSNTICNIEGDASAVCVAINISSTNASGLADVSLNNNVIKNIVSGSSLWGSAVNIVMTTYGGSNVSVIGNDVMTTRRGFLFRNKAGDSVMTLARNNLVDVTGTDPNDDYYVAVPGDAILYDNRHDGAVDEIN